MRRKIKLNVNYRDEVKVKRRADLFWVNYHFNFIRWQLQHLPLNWWNGNRIVCSDLTFSLRASECDSTLMNLLSSLIPSWRCTAPPQDWHLCRANTRVNTRWMRRSRGGEKKMNQNNSARNVLQSGNWASGNFPSPLFFFSRPSKATIFQDEINSKICFFKLFIKINKKHL